jgi:hypothetical protein
MENLGLVIFLLFLIGLLTWRARNHPRSLRDVYDGWVRENGLTLIHSERRYFLAGPFTWDRAGVCYRIEVRTRSGEKRTGWVKFGYNFFARQPWVNRVVWDADLERMRNQSPEPVPATGTPPAGQESRHV